MHNKFGLKTLKETKNLKIYTLHLNIIYKIIVYLLAQYELFCNLIGSL